MLKSALFGLIGPTMLIEPYLMTNYLTRTYVSTKIEKPKKKKKPADPKAEEEWGLHN